MSEKQRHFLKKREIKDIIKRASISLGEINQQICRKRIEVVTIAPQHYIFIVDGNEPVFLEIDGDIFPTLFNKVIGKLPKLIVDMNSIPHLCNGADLMAPGIVEIVGKFHTNDLAVVVDERFTRTLALVKTLFDSSKMAKMKRGKVAKNIHYVNDNFWKIYKSMKKSYN